MNRIDALPVSKSQAHLAELFELCEHSSPQGEYRSFSFDVDFHSFSIEGQTTWVVRSGSRLLGPILTAGDAPGVLKELRDLDDEACASTYAQ